MKVLHVIPSISPVRGGPSQAIFEMVSALRQEGVEAEIATTNDNAHEQKLEIPLNQQYDYPMESGETVPLYCFDRHASSHSFIHEYTFSKSLTSFLWKQVPQYDLIHIHAIFSYPSTVAMAIANFYGVPYLIRPLGSLCEWSLEQSQRQKAVYLKLIKRWLNQSAGLHFTADQEQQEVSRLNLKSDHFTIPLGLNFKDASSPKEASIRQQFDIHNNDPILLYLSRIHPKKGIEVLLKALSQVSDQSFNLILAGSGEDSYEQEIQSLIAEKHLESKVKTVGFVQGHLKQQLLSQADLFVLTSYSENFGIVVLEALAAGTPALVTPGVALSTLVEEHNLGWTCELNPQAITNTLEVALSNPQQLHQKGQHAQKLVRENYSWTAIAQKIAHQYQHILQQKPNPIHAYLSVFKNA